MALDADKTLGRKAGKPESRKVGKSEGRKAGRPEGRKAGRPESRKVGRPESRSRSSASTARLTGSTRTRRAPCTRPSPGTPDGLNTNAAGTLYTSVAQRPKELGRIAVDNALRAVEGKKACAMVKVPVKVVTKENVAGFGG
ncbi:hypothetical protein SHKM778_80650 [Streptomyces sp. KM77-8]|uniref:LacI family transcriptional regulator n=1 Tax=Streptomyces haneummycinicus TaxID=3074435 RepID=A0AAT9HXG9_9ACTN